MDILSVFIILWGSGGVWGVQWSKCVQAKQFLKRNSTKLFSSEIVPKAKQSMGYMDLPSNPF